MAFATLDDCPYLIIRVACRYCSRRKSFKRDWLLERWTRDGPIEELLARVTSNCTAALERTGKVGCNGGYIEEPTVHYKIWRSRDNIFHVLCRDDEFEGLPDKVRHFGPWMGGREGMIERLKPHYRLLLDEQGFVLIYRRPSKLEPEEACDGQ